MASGSGCRAGRHTGSMGCVLHSGKCEESPSHPQQFSRKQHPRGDLTGVQEEGLQAGRAESCCLPREELDGSSSGCLKLFLPHLLLLCVSRSCSSGMWERGDAGSGLGAGSTYTSAGTDSKGCSFADQGCAQTKQAGGTVVAGAHKLG